ncbi:MAG: hypothetical protein ACTS2F_28650 [Thainema sp.]
MARVLIGSVIAIALAVFAFQTFMKTSSSPVSGEDEPIVESSQQKIDDALEKETERMQELNNVE